MFSLLLRLLLLLMCMWQWMWVKVRSVWGIFFSFSFCFVVSLGKPFSENRWEFHVWTRIACSWFAYRRSLYHVAARSRMPICLCVSIQTGIWNHVSISGARRFVYARWKVCQHRINIGFPIRSELPTEWVFSMRVSQSMVKELSHAITQMNVSWLVPACMTA